jgi:hypothetical protein
MTKETVEDKFINNLHQNRSKEFQLHNEKKSLDSNLQQLGFIIGQNSGSNLEYN